jgi:flagellar hook assembly protein FlgD
LPLLTGARPNPFTVETFTTFTLPSTGAFNLTVYDIKGRRVKTLAAGSRQAGTYSATWDGSNSRGNRVSSGVYFGVLEFGGDKFTQRMLLLK